MAFFCANKALNTFTEEARRLEDPSCHIRSEKETQDMYKKHRAATAIANQVWWIKAKLLLSCLTLVLISAASSLANPERSQALVAEAWKAWGENNQPQVEAKLTAALREDPGNARAYLGLYFLYQMQDKEREAWASLKNILRAKEQAYPYRYAVWLSSVLKRQLDEPDSGALALLEEMSAGADPGGILKAMANEKLGNYYRQRGDLLKSNRYFQSMNAVKEWMIIGPFENDSASGFEKIYPPEMEFAPASAYAAKNGVPARWFRPAAIRADYWIDFTRYFPANGTGVFYANTFIYSPKKQTAQLRVGVSGSVKLFLNDEQLFAYFDENNTDLDTYTVETELQEGWNRVLIKCGHSEITQCNFMLRLTDGAGEPLGGLEIAAEAKPYARRPGAPVRVIENFAEAFFKAGIKENPERFENYLLLASCYLMNDKAVEAELVLREAVIRSPRCALFHTHLLEAYSRGEKYDEISTTHELIYSLDKNVPATLLYRTRVYLEKNEFDKAEEMIRQYERLNSNAERLLESKLVFHAKKGQEDKVREISQQGYGLYPANWIFALTEAMFSAQTTKKYDRAISLIEKYLAKRYDETALHTLAGLYLRAPDMKKWNETYHKLFALDPASTNYYYEMAQAYFSRQDYGAAEKMLRKALELCPRNSIYWSMVAR